MNNYKVTAVDTDSIFFKKPDETSFTEQEQNDLLNELNQIFPDMINWELGGYYRKVITAKAKNYILYDGKTTKYKGSAFKSSTLETGFKQFLDECVQLILNDKQSEVINVYSKYVKILCNIKDKDQMRLFSSKKTLTSKVYESERANETKVLDAIQGMEYSPGDKVWVFFKQDDTLSVVENFDGDYNVIKLLEKLYKVMQRFETIMDMTPYLNYKLKKNKKNLEDLLQSNSFTK